MPELAVVRFAHFNGLLNQRGSGEFQKLLRYFMLDQARDISRDIFKVVLRVFRRWAITLKVNNEHRIPCHKRGN